MRMQFKTVEKFKIQNIAAIRSLILIHIRAIIG